MLERILIVSSIETRNSSTSIWIHSGGLMKIVVWQGREGMISRVVATSATVTSILVDPSQASLSLREINLLLQT